MATGAVEAAASSPYSGKGSGELNLFRRLQTTFERGDLMLADALYCNYFFIAGLMSQGVDVLFEQHGARATDFRRGHSLGSRDHVVCWPKSARPAWMTLEQYKALPKKIEVREARVRHKVLVTTMLNHRHVSKQELGQLHAQRWHVELDLRNLKTTMGMEMLHCKTPLMNEKELWVYLLAHNLIRLLMAKAAQTAGIAARQLSYKHACQVWDQRYSQGPSLARDTRILLLLIAQIKVGK